MDRKRWKEYLSNDGKLPDRVRIEITGEQTQPDGTTEKTTTSHRGQYVKDKETHILRFEEKQEAGNRVPQINCIRVDPNCIVVEKSGQIYTKMIFRSGETYHCQYETGYGVIPMNIKTEHVALVFVGDTMLARTRYRMQLTEDYEILSRVTIRVIPA